MTKPVVFGNPIFKFEIPNGMDVKQEQSQDEIERGERLKAALNGRTVAWLAEKIHVAASTAHGYTVGKMPMTDKAMRICEVLDCDLRWYIHGAGDPAGGDSLVLVPQLNADGTTGEGVSYAASLLQALDVRDRSTVGCLMQAGNAMAPTVPIHAEVLFTTERLEAVDGSLYVLMIRGRPICRRIRIRQDGLLGAVCDNPAFGAEAAEILDESLIHGRVLWISSRPF